MYTIAKIASVLFLIYIAVALLQKNSLAYVAYPNIILKHISIHVCKKYLYALDFTLVKEMLVAAVLRL